MIKKISKLKEIGGFLDIDQKVNFQYRSNQNCNIIFGFNGSGKTTISNALTFFSDENFASEEEKREIYDDMKNGDKAEVELELENSTKIKYPASRSHNKSIYVFNQNFVSTHVFNGTKCNIKKFCNINTEIKNTKIDGLNQEIEKLALENDLLEKENQEIITKNEEITKAKSTELTKCLGTKSTLQSQDLLRSELPTKTLKEFDDKLNALKADYRLSKKQAELISDLENIKSVNFGLIDLDFQSIADILSKNIRQLSKEALEEKIKKTQDLFPDEAYKQSVERWFKFGKDILEKIMNKNKNNCPVCNTDISETIDRLFEDYQGYFDETYENYIQELNKKKEELSNIINVIDQYEKSSQEIEKVKIKYEEFLGQKEFKKINFVEINNTCDKLLVVLNTKSENIQKIQHLPEKIEEKIKDINKDLVQLNELKDYILRELESKKLNTKEIENEIRKIFKEIILLELNKTKKLGAIKKFKENANKLLDNKNNRSVDLHNKLSEELRKLKTEAKSISKYLAKMGINHFDIDINEQNEEENIIINYKETNTEKRKLKNCLSDGEKTALAFAYFLSKFENEINTEEKIKKSVIVVDDPISSLDENRLYSTAHLIAKKFEKVDQLLVLSHNFLFLKFFHSFYGGKSKCFFLDNSQIVELPQELKNFETPYFYMLRNLIDFIDKKTTYQEAKKYLPNFIRRILETFLSFKFARVYGKKENYSPGLLEFNECLDETNMKDTIKEELKDRIAEIDKICSLHSHGNAQHTQENFYISETELNTLAENTLFVIEKMDNLHKTAFIKKEESAT